MTGRQAEVLAAIADYIDQWGVPPTVRELADLLDIRPSAAHRHLVALRKLGAVEWDPGYNRTLRIVNRAS